MQGRLKLFLHLLLVFSIIWQWKLILILLLRFILKGYTKSKVFLIHVEVFLIKNKKDI